MDFTFEIERLRTQILQKKLDFTGSKSMMINIDIDTALVIPPHDYYYHIFQQVYYLLLNDCLQLNLTNYDMFKKYWKLSKKGKLIDLNYNCWITQLSEKEKNIMIQNLVTVSDFDNDHENNNENKKRFNNHGCSVCEIL